MSKRKERWAKFLTCADENKASIGGGVSEFEEGEHVTLKLVPDRGVESIEKVGSINPRFEVKVLNKLVDRIGHAHVETRILDSVRITVLAWVRVEVMK